MEKKWKMIKNIQQEYKKGKKKAELARAFHLDPRTISKYIQMSEMPLYHRGKRRRQTDGFDHFIQQLEQEGKTIREIDEYLRKHGYTGTSSDILIAVESIRKERKLQEITTPSVRISRQEMRSWIWNRNLLFQKMLGNYLNDLLRCIRHSNLFTKQSKTLEKSMTNVIIRRF